MPSLLDLPNELLTAIAQYLHPERPIYALIRTNRRLYHLLIDYLYRYNVEHPTECSGLSWAVRRGLTNTAARSIAHGADVEKLPIVGCGRGKKKEKPMDDRYDAAADDVERLKAVLNMNNCEQFTPTYAAAAGGHDAIVEMLIAHGARIDSPCGKWASPLQAADQCGRTEVVQRLLARGAVVDRIAPEKWDRTALHLACIGGHDASVQHLIEAGADVTVRNVVRETPLHLVLKCHRAGGPSKMGRLRTVLWLLVNGADTETRDRKGETPTSIAMQMEDEGSDLARLFRSGYQLAICDPEWEDREQLDGTTTPLQTQWAAYRDSRIPVEVEAAKAQRERDANAEEQLMGPPGLREKQNAARRVWTGQREQAGSRNPPPPVDLLPPSACTLPYLAWPSCKGRLKCRACKKRFTKCKYLKCPDCGLKVCRKCAGLLEMSRRA